MTFAAGVTLIPKVDRARLAWSFDQGESDYVVIEDGPAEYVGLVVGVHLDRIEHLDVIDAEGKWSLAKSRLK